MKYINTKTGAVIETDGQIAGGDWTPAEAPAKAPKKAKTKGAAHDGDGGGKAEPGDG